MTVFTNVLFKLFPQYLLCEDFNVTRLIIINYILINLDLELHLLTLTFSSLCSFLENFIIVLFVCSIKILHI
jgi:hypothetical protein